MLKLYTQSVSSQFQAALSMLKECLTSCPDECWTTNIGNFPFWHVAYHVLFYVDFYLSRDEAAFVAPPFHRENYQYFGRLPYPPHDVVYVDEPCDRQTLLEYVQYCRSKASKMITGETAESLAGPCGFPWYPIPRAEFYLNNLRHLQHHTAQLALHLRKSAGIDIGWVGVGEVEAGDDQERQ